MVPHVGKIYNCTAQYTKRHLVAKLTNASSATWWPNLAKFAINKNFGSAVQCATGNVCYKILSQDTLNSALCQCLLKISCFHLCRFKWLLKLLQQLYTMGFRLISHEVNSAVSLIKGSLHKEKIKTMKRGENVSAGRPP